MRTARVMFRVLKYEHMAKPARYKWAQPGGSSDFPVEIPRKLQQADELCGSTPPRPHSPTLDVSSFCSRGGAIDTHKTSRNTAFPPHNHIPNHSEGSRLALRRLHKSVDGMKWSSAWGAACDPCARAKTRCIRQQGTDEQRCNR